jgi:hypothetical protein
MAMNLWYHKRRKIHGVAKELSAVISGFRRNGDENCTPRCVMPEKNAVRKELSGCPGELASLNQFNFC